MNGDFEFGMLDVSPPRRPQGLLGTLLKVMVAGKIAGALGGGSAGEGFGGVKGSIGSPEAFGVPSTAVQGSSASQFLEKGGWDMSKLTSLFQLRSLSEGMFSNFVESMLSDKGREGRMKKLQALLSGLGFGG